MFSGVEDHGGRGSDTCLVSGKGQRSRAACMMAIKEPGTFKWVDVQGHRRPYCMAFNSSGNTPIS